MLRSVKFLSTQDMKVQFFNQIKLYLALTVRMFTLAGIMVLGASILKAQDPQFSQYYANALVLNPAFTGASNCHRFAAVGRLQWANIDGFYKTFAAAYDGPYDFGPTRHGLGISVIGDLWAGSVSISKVNLLLNYSYLLRLNEKHSIRLGLSGGATFTSLGSDYIFPENIEYNRFSDRNRLIAADPGTRITPDVNFGALYYNRWMWLGASLHHIVPATEYFILSTASNNRLPMRFSAHGGVTIPLNNRMERGTIPKDVVDARGIALIPSVLYRQQGSFNQLDLGMYLKFNILTFGIYGRIFEPDAIIGLIGIQAERFTIGYSYDYTISSLTNMNSGGSHELTFSYRFGCKDDPLSGRGRKGPRLSCPQF